ncbi:MAG TPA: GNAT family N-acetyltransferase [Vicinamibacterales bacterium]|nr:GNAT family N-acetyltransferase [Vicinamibacterales bacterium]
MPVTIRPATPADADRMLQIFRAVIATGDTYVFGIDTSDADARDYWQGPGMASWVAEREGEVVAMYKLIANRRDRGSHVANASFMVDPAQHRRGVGRLMGEHCLREAAAAGFRAMQFNFVVSTNTGAVALWKSLGFAIVGTSPQAFQHPQLGLVDAYVMHRTLEDLSA